MNNKSIGKIQIIIGTFFLIISIIGAILTGVLFYNGLTGSAEKMINQRTMFEKDSVDIQMLADHLTIEASIFVSSAVLAIGITLILILISLIMISQGLINKNKK